MGWKYCERVFFVGRRCLQLEFSKENGKGLMEMSRREREIVLFFFEGVEFRNEWKLMKLSKNWLFIFWERGRGELLKDRGLLKFRSQFCDILFWRASKFDKRKLMNLSGYYRILYSEINEWHYVIDNLHISACRTCKLYNLCKFYEIVRTVNLCVFRIAGI